jgi:hypothetical protein
MLALAMRLPDLHAMVKKTNQNEKTFDRQVLSR